MPPSDFAKANLDEVVDKLTMEEAISLIAGVGFWHTAAVERLGVPAVKASRVLTPHLKPILMQFLLSNAHSKCKLQPPSRDMSLFTICRLVMDPTVFEAIISS